MKINPTKRYDLGCSRTNRRPELPNSGPGDPEPASGLVGQPRCPGAHVGPDHRPDLGAQDLEVAGDLLADLLLETACAPRGWSTTSA